MLRKLDQISKSTSPHPLFQTYRKILFKKKTYKDLKKEVNLQSLCIWFSLQHRIFISGIPHNIIFYRTCIPGNTSTSIATTIFKRQSNGKKSKYNKGSKKKVYIMFLKQYCM